MDSVILHRAVMEIKLCDGFNVGSTYLLVIIMRGGEVNCDRRQKSSVGGCRWDLTLWKTEANMRPGVPGGRVWWRRKAGRQKERAARRTRGKGHWTQMSLTLHLTFIIVPGWCICIRINGMGLIMSLLQSQLGQKKTNVLHIWKQLDTWHDCDYHQDVNLNSLIYMLLLRACSMPGTALSTEDTVVNIAAYCQWARVLMGRHRQKPI